MDINGLTPEERAALKEALNQEEPPDPISTLASVLEMVLDKFEEVTGKLDRLENDFYKTLLGGIDGMYKENMRAEGMKGFHEKHGGMFSPYADDFKRIFGDDLMEKAYDYLESLKGEEGYSDEVGQGKLSELVEQIKSRIGPKEPPAVAEVTKIEAGPTEPAPESSDGIDSSLEDEIARMKKRDEEKESSRGPARKRA